MQLQCCWNGVVVVKAEPFYAGLVFRSNLPGECGASECSHFCRDMAGLNYSIADNARALAAEFTYEAEVARVGRELDAAWGAVGRAGAAP